MEKQSTGREPQASRYCYSVTALSGGKEMQLASRASSAHAAYIPKEGLQVGVRNTGRNKEWPGRRCCAKPGCILRQSVGKMGDPVDSHQMILPCFEPNGKS